MPIRNPLDCAISNLKGKAKLFSHLKIYSQQSILNAVLDEFVWFFRLKEQYPDRFFYFFEYEFTRKTALDLLHFLRLEHDSQWEQDALQAYQIKSNYTHGDTIIDYYAQSIHDKFNNYPAILRKLLQFVEKE